MADKKEAEYKLGGGAEPEIIATAIPSNEPPVPAGHHRFYCSKCRTVRTDCFRCGIQITDFCCFLLAI